MFITIFSSLDIHSALWQYLERCLSLINITSFEPSNCMFLLAAQHALLHFILSVSCFDFNERIFCHLMMLKLMLMMTRYRIASHRAQRLLLAPCNSSSLIRVASYFTFISLSRHEHMNLPDTNSTPHPIPPHSTPPHQVVQ